MKELQELELKIEFLRKKMHKMIESNNKLISQEVVMSSKELDKILTRYFLIKECGEDKGREIK